MDISILDLRFKVSSDNENIVDINEEDWMIEYETEGSFTNTVWINIFGKLVDNDKYVNIGSLHGRYFKIDRIMEKGASLFDIFDSIDQDTYMVYEALIDEEGNLDSDYCGLKSNVFHIERFYIGEIYRNKGYGEIILDHIDDVLNYSLNCEIGCFILTPNPIEKINEVGFEVIKDSHLNKKLKIQLLRFYSKCGFKMIPNTEFMYHNTDYIKAKRDFNLL